MFQRIDSNAASQSSIARLPAQQEQCRCSLTAIHKPRCDDDEMVGPPTTNEVCLLSTNERTTPHMLATAIFFSTPKTRTTRAALLSPFAHVSPPLFIHTPNPQAGAAHDRGRWAVASGERSGASFREYQRTALHSLAAARSEAPRPSLLGQGTGRSAEYVRVCRRAPRGAGWRPRRPDRLGPCDHASSWKRPGNGSCRRIWWAAKGSSCSSSQRGAPVVIGRLGQAAARCPAAGVERAVGAYWYRERPWRAVVLRPRMGWLALLSGLSAHGRLLFCMERPPSAPHAVHWLTGHAAAFRPALLGVSAGIALDMSWGARCERSSRSNQALADMP